MRKLSPLSHPVARARGLGSAKSGLHHWVVERVTAVALIPLTFWFVWSMIGLAQDDAAMLGAWLQSPWQAMLTAAFVLVTAWHTALGMQVVYDDYIHCPALKAAAVLGTRALCALLALGGLMAIFKLHYGL